MIARCCGWVSLQASDSELGDDIFLPAAVPVVLPCCATRAQTEVDGASDFRVFEGTLRSQVVCLVPYVPCAMPTTRNLLSELGPFSDLGGSSTWDICIRDHFFLAAERTRNAPPLSFFF